jgi:hypothetical protein
MLPSTTAIACDSSERQVRATSGHLLHKVRLPNSVQTDTQNFLSSGEKQLLANSWLESSTGARFLLPLLCFILPLNHK